MIFKAKKENNSISKLKSIIIDKIKDQIIQIELIEEVSNNTNLLLKHITNICRFKERT